MKVGSFENKPITPASNGSASATASGKSGAAGAQPEASAQVALSPVATVLVNEGNAEFDAAKVARIAQAIRDGKFKVNPEAIADKLITSTRDLLGGAQH